MKYHDDLYEGLSFSVPRSIKDKINERARRLRMTRSDYLKTLVLSDLDRGPDAPLEIRPGPLPLAPVSDGSQKKTRK
jgi:hypothetical protein